MWKQESLKIIPWGGAKAKPFTLLKKGKIAHEVPVKRELKIVGVTIPNDGNPTVCQQERADIATSAVYAGKRIWTNRYLAATQKLHFYYEQKVPIYLYGCEIWPLSQTTLSHIDKWHKHALRTVLSWRWNPQTEHHHDFLQKATRFAENSYNAKHKHPIIHYLERVVSFILMENNDKVERKTVKLFLKEQRQWRDTAEWRAIQAINQKDAGYSASWRHGRRGTWAQL